MAVRDVTSTADRVFAAGEMTLPGLKEVIKSAGKSISREELDAFEAAASRPNLRTNREALGYAQETVQTLRGLLTAKDEMNETVRREAPRLAAAEEDRMRLGVETRSFGGTVIPEAVKEIVTKALAAGAIPYDVREVKDPEWSEEHGEFELPGKWTPYPQEIAARGSMSFAHTEITPEKVKKDMETVQKYTQLAGYTEERVNLPVAGGQPQTVRTPKYRDVEGKGTGNITAHYDESHHRDVYARGTSGQIWANNFAILSDGSLHCLPAMRRSEHTRHILTNPSLARGQRMLANGHIEMRNGVITELGLSGRLQNRVNDGDAKLVDPLAILRAWGFAIAPDCKVTFEGQGPDPRIDPNTNVIG
ncbi:hypothetical protein L6R52_02760 [Myxococcota bacterium]|nr:hypothetical protein [Myxococcota bacterium]